MDIEETHDRNSLLEVRARAQVVARREVEHVRLHIYIFVRLYRTREVAAAQWQERGAGGKEHQDPVIEMLPRNVRRTSSIVSKSVVSIRTICLPVARSICSICCQVALLCTKLTEIPFRPKRPVRPAKTRRDRETRL